MELHTVNQVLNSECIEKIYIETCDGQKITGIISKCRLDRRNDTNDKYIYDIRHIDNDWGKPATVEHHVSVNWFSCLIVDEPIVFPKDTDHLIINDYSFDNE